MTFIVDDGRASNNKVSRISRIGISKLKKLAISSSTQPNNINITTMADRYMSINGTYLLYSKRPPTLTDAGMTYDSYLQTYTDVYNRVFVIDATGNYVQIQQTTAQPPVTTSYTTAPFTTASYYPTTTVDYDPIASGAFGIAVNGVTSIRYGPPSSKPSRAYTNTNRASIPCPWPGCTSRFRGNSELQRHIREQHKEDPRFFCMDCYPGVGFKRRDHLKSHQVATGHSNSKDLSAQGGQQ